MSFESFIRVPHQEETPEYIPEIPEQEIIIKHAKSSGPGGQNVNKRNTKADVRWHVLGSNAFTDAQKIQIERTCRGHMNNEGCLVVQASSSRSQEQNTQDAINRLQEMVREALTPQKERIPTEPSYAAKRARTDEKKLGSRQKAERQKRWTEDD